MRPVQGSPIAIEQISFNTLPVQSPCRRLGDSVSLEIWKKCLDYLQEEYPAQQFNTWLRPLQAQYVNGELQLYAPNKFVLDWVSDTYLSRIRELLGAVAEGQARLRVLRTGTVSATEEVDGTSAGWAVSVTCSACQQSEPVRQERAVAVEGAIKDRCSLKPASTRETDV